ncbi:MULTISPECIES: anti-sigma regulatory factor [Sutcliffiella]|uniref:anti-sigma regulatory factor n=1 Tax=Sutcliffiella TaxID=2837511 RepID=UPI0022DE240E|nr:MULTISPECIES: anti-sigma regulatory factor [Sutcliffiella]MED4017334.1 anti-sigma regulatory factor [Sutcliffiella cohnii]WBL15345.1 anti-sigma regulatory factor [Sutcliffiella sp. NC1]
MTVQSCVTIRNEWDIVAARQMGRNVAKEMGFGTVDQARITTAISELARNIYLYAGTGQVCLEAVTEYNKTGLRIIAQDNGPGIVNIRQVMEDGYSTSGGLGAGLPGVKRLMDNFQIDSNVGEGTRIEAVKWVR